MASRAFSTALVLVATLVAALPCHGQGPDNVAVVINEASAASVSIGDRYVSVRKVPASNVIRIRATTEEQVERSEYTQTIENPIAAALERGGLQDRILYVVLTKGIPLKIVGTQGRNGTAASVDSELTLLYRRMTGVGVPTAGPVPNPYYAGDRPINAAQPFTHRAHDIFLVTRLDGFTVADALALIDRGQASSKEGQVVLDQRAAPNDPGGDRWLKEAATRLEASGHSARVVLEESPMAARPTDKVLGYYSWGSNDPQSRARRSGLQFVPGAVAATFTSNDARTFSPPPSAWMPGSVDRKDWFSGSSQSLTADLIADGATGVAGNVTEPYLDGAIRPEALFPAYFSGSNLVEAFYLAMPYLSWQTVVIGDPLCAPFRTVALPSADIEEAVDTATELPGFFSRRRMANARATMKDVPAVALGLVMRARTRLARDDRAGARQYLEEALVAAPESTQVRLELAVVHEGAQDYNRAVEQYRQVIRIQPNNVIALNNLAYVLAVHQKTPAEALPLARRALGLAPNNAGIIDTLAWVEYLLGNNLEAARLLAPVIRQTTGSAVIHLHAATILAALGKKAEAETQMAETLRLEPALSDRDDVKALRQQIDALKK